MPHYLQPLRVANSKLTSKSTYISKSLRQFQDHEQSRKWSQPQCQCWMLMSQFAAFISLTGLLCYYLFLLTYFTDYIRTDSISRPALRLLLSRLGITGKIINLMKSLYDQSVSCVRAKDYKANGSRSPLVSTRAASLHRTHLLLAWIGSLIWR